MAYFKFAEEGKKVYTKITGFGSHYENPDAVEKVIYYITRTNLDPARGKEPPLYVNSFGTPPNDVGEMILNFYTIKKIYNKPGGRQLYHMIMGFDENEEQLLYQSGKLYEFADQIAYFFFVRGFQIVYAIHRNEMNLHIHFAMNSVNYYDGLKYQISFGVPKKTISNYFYWILQTYIHDPARLPMEAIYFEPYTEDTLWVRDNNLPYNYEKPEIRYFDSMEEFEKYGC